MQNFSFIESFQAEVHHYKFDLRFGLDSKCILWHRYLCDVYIVIGLFAWLSLCFAYCACDSTSVFTIFHRFYEMSFLRSHRVFCSVFSIFTMSTPLHGPTIYHPWLLSKLVIVSKANVPRQFWGERRFEVSREIKSRHSRRRKSERAIRARITSLYDIVYRYTLLLSLSLSLPLRFSILQLWKQAPFAFSQLWHWRVIKNLIPTPRRIMYSSSIHPFTLSLPLPWSFTHSARIFPALLTVGFMRDIR